MSVLNDKKDDQKQVAKQAQRTGYERPLFEDFLPKWSDEPMIGGGIEKSEARYHDKEMVLKVTNGLCYDIFFRAEDVNRPDFDKIPDFAEPVDEKDLSPEKQRLTYTKPLDSKHKQRSPGLTPTEQKSEKASGERPHKKKFRKRSRRRR